MDRPNLVFLLFFFFLELLMSPLIGSKLPFQRINVWRGLYMKSSSVGISHLACDESDRNGVVGEFMQRLRKA